MAQAACIQNAPVLAQGNGLLSAFDTAGFGCILLDNLGRAVRHNSQAEAYLGSALYAWRNCLLTFDAQVNEALERLIRHVLGTATEQEAEPVRMVLLPRPAKRPLVLRAIPIQGTADESGAEVCAALLIIDVEECAQPDSALLVGLFHLTPAEIRIARRLACGDGPGEIAANLGIGVGTVRNMIKSLFHKTGTSRQAELVSLLAHLGRLQLPGSNPGAQEGGALTSPSS
ncbi:MAG TPA: helix-turn-helix transcriptional regulator [Chloroflexota bacterium]|nr:helix-turn-helix transcriptional regulator [Chloroflexota bacterium]